VRPRADCSGLFYSAKVTGEMENTNNASNGPACLSYAMAEEFLFEPVEDMLSSADSGSSSSPGEDLADAPGSQQSLDSLLSSPVSVSQRSQSSRASTGSKSSGISGSLSLSSSPRHKGSLVGRPKLDVASIEAARQNRCRCRVSDQPTKCCMDLYDVGDIFRLRYERSQISASEEVQRRQTDLQRAMDRSPHHCRIEVEGKLVCLKTYCSLYGINGSAMRRTWANMTRGSNTEGRGRPHGSVGLGRHSQQRLEAYAWLKAWVDLFGDEDPVGAKYKYVVNYVLLADLHKEYKADYESSVVHTSSNALSERSFRRVWTQFCEEQKVRVRRKANTTTKCQGEAPS
jgi:hypothetical protein